MRRLSGLLVEMRRRRVFRTAGLYIVGAWVALQVADLAFESWGISPRALRYVWVAAAIGLPVAIVFGWRFDIVGGRIVRCTAATSGQDFSLHRSDFALLGALGAIFIATILGVGAGLSLDEQTDVVKPEFQAKSIAVLPFDTPGGNAGDVDVLALGIQEDLLTRLSRIGDLNVVSRTSVERFRYGKTSSPEIGRQLGVGRILEGSVLEADGRIRVNVQLIDALNDTHLWAKSYEQSFSATNLFEIQGAIVDAIARELRATMSAVESVRLARMPTTNLDAYTVYLKGVSKADIESIEALYEAIDHYRMAIELDPAFALAHVALADAYLTLSTNFLGGLGVEESMALAEPPLARALDLDPQLGPAYATLGLLEQLGGDIEAAEQAYARAIELRPSYPRVFRLSARLAWQQGEREEALRLAEQALVLDPYSAPVNFDIARYYDVTGRFDEALERYLRVVEIEPDHAFAYVYIAAIHYLVYGRADESLVWYHEAAAHDALSPSLHAAPAIPYLELGLPGEAEEWVKRSVELGAETFWSSWARMLLDTYLGNKAGAVAEARAMLGVYPRYWGALHILCKADVAAGRYDAARSRYARTFRELVEPELPAVDVDNYFAAVDFALVLLRLGETDRANDLLHGSLETIAALPRHGTDGFWITDVRIYALQQRPKQALAALREAVNQGWRVLAWFYLDHDPALDTLRGEPEFERLRNEIARDMARQAERVRELRASGELIEA